MIIINDEEKGLGKPRWMRKINFKNAVKMAVAPHTLIPKKHLNFKNVVKMAVAPHTLIPRNKRKSLVKTALMPHTLFLRKRK